MSYMDEEIENKKRQIEQVREAYDVCIDCVQKLREELNQALKLGDNGTVELIIFQLNELNERIDWLLELNASLTEEIIFLNENRYNAQVDNALKNAKQQKKLDLIIIRKTSNGFSNNDFRRHQKPQSNNMFKH